MSTRRQVANSNWPQVAAFLMQLILLYHSVCIAATETQLALTFIQQPHRIINFDESGMQRVGAYLAMSIAPKGTAAPKQRAEVDDKTSVTLLSWGTASGKELPPVYVMQGQVHMED